MRVLALSLILALTSGQAGAQRPSSGARAVQAYRPGIDVLNYDLSLELPDSGNIIRGVAVLSVRRTTPIDSLTLDLVRLAVDSVAVDGRPVAFSRTDTTLTLPLPRGQGTARVAVSYMGPVDDGLVIRTDSAGRWTGFGDNWPNRGRLWIPSVDHPRDKATVTWRVTAPSARTVIANGSLVSRTPAGTGRTTTEWRESKPIPVYLMVIAAAPLVEHDLGQTACGLGEISRCVPQMVFTAPEQGQIAPGNFARAGEMVQLFARLVGPYPYEKLAHLQSSTRFGGMENASAIFYADNLFRRGGAGETIIAHETAHQWFGDAVTEREWPHLWLSEGFATYFAALWDEHAHGDSAFRAHMANVRRSVIGDTSAVVRRPVIDTVETELLRLLNNNSYEKGGFVLHMLRDVVGDSAFFRGIRAYYATHRHGNAMSSDLQLAMERASKRELGWFFDQWLRRPGYAEVRVAWSRSSDGRLMLDVEQGSRFGAFRFPLTVVITDAQGRSRRARINVPATPTSVLTLPGRYTDEPRHVELDPDVRVLGTIETRQK